MKVQGVKLMEQAAKESGQIDSGNTRVSKKTPKQSSSLPDNLDMWFKNHRSMIVGYGRAIIVALVGLILTYWAFDAKNAALGIAGGVFAITGSFLVYRQYGVNNAPEKKERPSGKEAAKESFQAAQKQWEALKNWGIWVTSLSWFVYVLTWVGIILKFVFYDAPYQFIRRWPLGFTIWKEGKVSFMGPSWRDDVRRDLTKTQARFRPIRIFRYNWPDYMAMVVAVLILWVGFIYPNFFATYTVPTPQPDGTILELRFHQQSFLPNEALGIILLLGVLVLLSVADKDKTRLEKYGYPTVSIISVLELFISYQNGGLVDPSSGTSIVSMTGVNCYMAVGAALFAIVINVFYKPIAAAKALTRGVDDIRISLKDVNDTIMSHCSDMDTEIRNWLGEYAKDPNGERWVKMTTRHIEQAATLESVRPRELLSRLINAEKNEGGWRKNGFAQSEGEKSGFYYHLNKYIEGSLQKAE